MANGGDSIRLGPWHQACVYGATGLLVLSGLGWLGFHFLLAPPPDLAPGIHPAEPWMLRIHGAAAMAGLVVYGSLLPIHVRRAWLVRRNLYLGIGLISLMLLLTLSGYLLYYAGGEETRPYISLAHWVVGLATPLLLWWHVLSGRAGSRRRRTPAAGA